MITRRKIVLALGAGALLPLASLAQSQKVYRVGILAFRPSERHDSFTQGLQELGYVEGKNISFERRFSEGNVNLMSAQAEELVQLKVDIIFAPTTSVVQAAKQVAGTIPIVFAVASDPVGSGFVASLARPGGNITGTSIVARELSAKRMQILKEAFPKSARVAACTASEPIAAVNLEEAQHAAKTLGIEVLPITIQRRTDFEQASALLRKWRTDSLYVVECPTNLGNRTLLAEFAAKTQLPSMCPVKEYAEAGGLISYGVNYNLQYRRAATYVDKILKGVKPADLPVEQPTKFELVLNMKTAKALGIKFPQSILVQATKVIE